MKVLLSCISALALTAPLALSADYSVFRVCEDQHVLRTSDGADAGHVQYIVVDPGEQRVVSTIVTGGVLGERNVVVPMTALHFGGSREVVIENVTRERLVSAPVIEQTQITHITSGHFEPALIERSSQYFGVGARGGVEVGGHERGMARERANAPGGRESVTTEGGRTPQSAERAGQAATEPSTGAAQGKNAQERQQMREQRKAAAAQKEGQTATGKEGATATGKEGATPSEQKKAKSEAAGQAEKATKDSKNEPSSSERKSEHGATPEKSSTKGMKEPGAQSSSSSSNQPGEVSTGTSSSRESGAKPAGKHETERSSTTGEKKSGSSTEKSSTERGAGSSSTSTSTPSTKVNQ